MALFAVLLQQASPSIVASIKQKFPEPNCYEITSTQWVVSSKGTAKKISDTIGITGPGDESIGNGVVLAFTGYWGRSSSDLWEWMKTRIEESDNG